MKITPQHYGYHQATPVQYRVRIDFAREHRRVPTMAEKTLWKALKGKRLAGHKFRRQHIIGDFIVDFVCLAHGLIIEVDGGIHLKPEHILLDRERTERLEAIGFRLIRFPNEAVLDDLDTVLNAILEALEAGGPVPGIC